MSDDILERIDESLTFYSAGLGEELTVPVESRHASVDDFQAFCRAELAEAWAIALERGFSIARGGIRWPMESP